MFLLTALSGTHTSSVEITPMLDYIDHDSTKLIMSSLASWRVILFKPQNVLQPSSSLPSSKHTCKISNMGTTTMASLVGMNDDVLHCILDYVCGLEDSLHYVLD